MSRRDAALWLSLALALTGASCAADPGAVHRTRSHRPHDAVTTAATAPTTTAPPTTTGVPTAPPPGTVPPSPTTRPPTPRVQPPVATSAPAPPPLLVTRLTGVGDASQVVAVSAAGYGRTLATLTAFQHDAAGWHQVFGPWQAHIGAAGFAPPGQKREGDERTPSGSFGLDFFFGVLGDPGVQFPYRPVTGPQIVWDDDPASPLYNQWVDATTADAGAKPEPMDQTPAYDYGAVIAYNMNPTTPGTGSAIFLHVSTGGSTAGCVSLPTPELLAVLRWLSPGAQPRIIMGTASTIAP